MKLAFYKVDNSKGYERHTFDDICDKPEEVLNKLYQLNDDEWHIYDFSNPSQIWGVVDSADFQEDYNDEILDGGWWCVVLKEKKQHYAVTYVGLSDSEYGANGCSDCRVFDSLDAAKAELKRWRGEEIAHLEEEGRDYEILEDDDDECRISWCGHGEQVRIEIHPVEINVNTRHNEIVNRK